MAARFSITIDAAKLEGLAKSLAKVDGATLGRAALTGLNDTAAQAYEDARAKMNRGINLTDDYLKSRMELKPAENPVLPVATIKARGDLTNLISYRPQSVAKVVRFPNSMIAPLIGKFGPNPRKPGSVLPWKLRKGDAARGIPVDQKQAGVRVEVTRGSAKLLEHSFVITSRGYTFVGSRAAGDHHGKGKVHAKLGPSVYQLFRHALDTAFLDGVQESLGKSVVDVTAAELKRAFE